MKKIFCITILLLQTLIYLPTFVLAETTPPNTAQPTTTTTTTTPPDEDDDGIPNTQDNCPRTKNENQVDRNDNLIGDACDTEYQNSILSQLNRAITNAENIQEVNPGSQNANLNFGYNCQAASTSNQSTDFCTDNQPIDEKFTKLYNALQNKQIMSVLEEPISTENIFNRAQICTTKYLRDKNGFLKFTNLNLGNIQNLEIDFDDENTIDSNGQINLRNIPEGELYLQALENNNLKVGIALDKCETKYVQQCTPNSSYIREVKLGYPLPTIVTCDRVQILFGSSGIDLLKQYVGLVYKWATGIVGVIAVFIIMIQGIIIATAGGDDGKIGEAKTKIIESLSAIAILFLSGIILYTINPNYFTATNLQNELEEMQQNTEIPTTQENPETTTPPTE